MSIFEFVAAEPVVIVGTGHAAFQLAASLRQEGHEGPLTLIGEEPGLPYRRPPLSKKFLKTEDEPASVDLRRAGFYETNHIDIIDKVRVTELDLHRKKVWLKGGRTIPFGHLVLAVGARNRPPPIPGLDADGILGLRTREDGLRLRRRLKTTGRLIVVGAGFIGLEVAATARLLGIEVIVLEAAGRAMGRGVSTTCSAWFEAAHRTHGVDLRLDQAIAEVRTRAGRFAAVRTEGGEEIAGDLLLVATGVLPNTELAEQAGLATDNGICVDAHLATAAADVSAIGDCCSFRPPGRPPGNGRSLRLESVQNAVDQAKCVARRLVGQPQPYDAVPWFWSDQYKLKLQIAGLTAEADQTVPTRDPESGRFSICCFRNGALIGIESVSHPGDHMAARQILKRRLKLTPERAAAAGFTVADFFSEHKNDGGPAAGDT